MCNRQILHDTATVIAGLAVAGTLGLSPVSAQTHEDWKPVQVVEAGTKVSVRTTRAIDERDLSGRVFPGVVDQD